MTGSPEGRERFEEAKRPLTITVHIGDAYMTAVWARKALEGLDNSVALACVQRFEDAMNAAASARSWGKLGADAPGPAGDRGTSMRHKLNGPIDPYLGGLNTDGPPDPPEHDEEESPLQRHPSDAYAELVEEFAALLRYHTRAIWALKGEIDYPEAERAAVGSHAAGVLKAARAALDEHQRPKEGTE